MIAAVAAAFWRAVEAGLHPRVVAAGPERRAQGRFISAACLFVGVIGLLVAPLNLVRPGAAPLVALAISAVGFGLFAVLRATGAVRGISLVFLGLLAFVGPGVDALYPEIGSPGLAWVLIVGFAPLLVPSIAVTLSAVVATVVAAALGGAPVAPGRVISSPGDVIPVVVTAWVITVVVFSLHRRAVGELSLKLASERALEARIEETTAALTARASDTVGFLTTVSHELRTPLNGVLGITGLLGEEPVAPAVHARLEQIHGAGRSVLRAFETLLCLTRLTAAGTSPTQPVDLPGVADAALSKAAHEFRAAAPVLRLAIEDGAPRIVHTNLVVLRTLLDQLLGSALDAGVRQAVLHVGLRPGAVELRLMGEHGGVVPPTAGERSPLSLGIPLAAELARAAGGACSPVQGSATGLKVSLVLPCTLPDPASVGA